MSKSTAVETTLRVEKVTELLLKGFSRKKICKYMLNNEGLKISISQIDRYIQKARLGIEAYSKRNIASDYAFAIARLEYLYGEAVEKGNLNIAVRIIKDIVALQGLSRPKTSSNEPEYNDKNALYYTFGCYAQAIKSTVTEEQVKEIVDKAMVLGSGVNIEDIPSQDSPKSDHMSLAVEDYRLIKRGRTREELERDNWRSIRFEDIDRKFSK